MNKILFYDLCKKYNVKLSSVAKQPKLKKKNNLQNITKEDIKKILKIK